MKKIDSLVILSEKNAPFWKLDFMMILNFDDCFKGFLHILLRKYLLKLLGNILLFKKKKKQNEENTNVLEIVCWQRLILSFWIFIAISPTLSSKENMRTYIFQHACNESWRGKKLITTCIHLFYKSSITKTGILRRNFV